MSMLATAAAPSADPLVARVLAAIAAHEGLPAGSLWLGDHDAVWYRDVDGNLRVLCQRGTRYWHEHAADVACAALLARLVRACPS